MTQHKPGTASGGSGTTHGDCATTASPVPAWQIASSDVVLHQHGAALMVRVKDTEGGIRGKVRFTFDLPGPHGDRLQDTAVCASSDRLLLAEDCADEALTTWAQVLAGAA